MWTTEMQYSVLIEWLFVSDNKYVSSNEMNKEFI